VKRSRVWLCSRSEAEPEEQGAALEPLSACPSAVRPALSGPAGDAGSYMRRGPAALLVAAQKFEKFSKARLAGRSGGGGEGESGEGLGASALSCCCCDVGRRARRAPGDDLAAMAAANNPAARG
jgi:hypothetical protein